MYFRYLRPTITVMNSFWLNYFSDCRTAENVRIVCRDGVLQSHKLFLSAVSSDLRSYIVGQKTCPNRIESILWTRASFLPHPVDACGCQQLIA